MTLQALRKVLASLVGSTPEMEVEIIVDGEGFEIDEVSLINGRVVIEVEENDEEYLT
jgi:hypothetical protein